MKDILKNIRNDLSKKFHPDVGGSNEAMQAINVFYDNLVDKLPDYNTDYKPNHKPMTDEEIEEIVTEYSKKWDDLEKKNEKLKKENDGLKRWKREMESWVKDLKDENEMLTNQLDELNKKQKRNNHQGAHKMNILGWTIAKSGEYFRAHKKINGKTKSIYIGKSLDEAQKIIAEKMNKL